MEVFVSQAWKWYTSLLFTFHQSREGSSLTTREVGKLQRRENNLVNRQVISDFQSQTLINKPFVISFPVLLLCFYSLFSMYLNLMILLNLTQIVSILCSKPSNGFPALVYSKVLIKAYMIYLPPTSLIHFLALSVLFTPLQPRWLPYQLSNMQALSQFPLPFAQNTCSLRYSQTPSLLLPQIHVQTPVC